MAEHVQLFILSRNRPEYLLQTLESALQINYESYEIIVSDNSTTDEVSKVLESHPLKNRFKLRKRKSMDYFNEHVNLIKSEVTSPYFMMFHDDDLLSPNCISDYMVIMLNNPQIAACTGNAKIIHQNAKSEDLFSIIKQDVLISEPSKFIDHHFDLSHGHQPFPFYLYRSEKVRGLYVNYGEGRIHSDTAFIFKVMQKGGLYWSQQIVGYYRLHANNTSHFINMRAIYLLCRFIKSKVNADLQTRVQHYYQRSRVRFYFQNKHHFLHFLKFARHRKLILGCFIFIGSNLGFYSKKVLSRFGRT